MRISDWSSDVCSSDLGQRADRSGQAVAPVLAKRSVLHAVPQPAHATACFQPVNRGCHYLLYMAVKVAAPHLQGAIRGTVRQAQYATRHYLTFGRSEEHTSELQSLMRISYAVFCLKTKIHTTQIESI